jgi:DNA-binding PadR family transcriptional regulator
MSETPDIDVAHQADDRTDNPTELSDVTLLHPDDFAAKMDDSTLFQVSTLLAIQNLSVRGEPCYGLAIKGELEKIYRTAEIHHGRLYPNLDTLKERDLIVKKPIDDRANSYQLTPSGKGLLKRYAETVVGLINGVDYDDIAKGNF